MPGRNGQGNTDNGPLGRRQRDCRQNGGGTLPPAPANIEQPTAGRAFAGQGRGPGRQQGGRCGARAGGGCGCGRGQQGGRR